MTLVVKDLSVTYETGSGRKLLAVDGIDLKVERGEFVVVIGPSGCGKSTLLYCIGGLLRPSSGKITFDDKEIVEPVPRRGAFVFQDYGLYPWKTVVENAALGLRFAGTSRKARRAAAMTNLELVGLADFAESYPGELSGGMQQRVAVARALTMDPDMLLLDEPFGAVDEQSRRYLGLEMSRILAMAGKTTLFVTHSLEEAIFWADRVIVMSARPGRILEEIRVDQPRPRDLDFMTDQWFHDLRSRLFSLLTNSAGEQAETTSTGAHE